MLYLNCILDEISWPTCMPPPHQFKGVVAAVDCSAHFQNREFIQDKQIITIMTNMDFFFLLKFWQDWVVIFVTLKLDWAIITIEEC